jgi:hypothetical protein
MEGSAMKTTRFALVVAAAGILAVVFAASAPAELVLVNGNFNEGLTGTDEVDVEDPWYDETTAIFWQTTWHINRASPAFTGSPSPYVGFSGPGVGPTTNKWLYQPIGTREVDDTEVTVYGEIGSFSDAAPDCYGTMTVSIYQSATFAPANDVDIALSDATLIAQNVLETGLLAPAEIFNIFIRLDISAANTADPLYLHFNWVGGTDGTSSGWMAMDNIGIVTDVGPVVATEVRCHDEVVVGGAKTLAMAVSYQNLPDPIVHTSHADLTWSSSDTNVLAVSNEGRMTGLATGAADVVGTWEGAAVPPKTITVTPRMLKHRYSFNGEYTNEFEFPEPDSVGGADAFVYYALERNGTGQLDLQAGLQGYVDLPNSIVSTLGSAAFEIWMTPRAAGGAWQRIWDFGITDIGELDFLILTSVGTRYLTLMARFGNVPQLFFEFAGGGVIAGPTYTPGQEMHTVVVYDTAAGVATLYLNGIPVGSTTDTPLLDTVSDVNNWLGRSQFSGDSFTDGLYNELRIYQGTITPEEIAANYAFGPDGEPLADPGTITGLSLSAAETDLILGRPGVLAAALGEFTNVSGVPLNGFAGIVFTSEDPGVVDVAENGLVTPVAPGAANVWAQYGGLSNSLAFTVSQVDKPATLVHRWSFNEAPGATTALDAVGGAHGTVIGANYAFTGSQLDLFGTGTSGGAATDPTLSYVDLPDNLLSGIGTTATFEVFFTWDGGGAWQRVFDFGNSTAVNFFLTPANAAGLPRVAITTTGAGGEFQVDGDEDTPAGVPQHIVYTFDGEYDIAQLYVNGTLTDSTAPTLLLEDLAGTNNWFGRAQYGADALFNGRLDEIRIYTGFMTADQVVASMVAGPDYRPRIGDAAIVGDTIRLTWTETAEPSGFAVDEAPSIGAGDTTAWTPTGVAVTETNGTVTATVPLSGAGESYYRLRK